MTPEEREEKRREYDRRLRAERIAWGLCTYCGKNKPVQGYKMCEDCRMYHASMKMMERSVETPEQRKARIEDSTERSKRRQAKLRAEGKCINCGKTLDGKSRTRCRKCLDKCARSARRRYRDGKGED